MPTSRPSGPSSRVTVWPQGYGVRQARRQDHRPLSRPGRPPCRLGRRHQGDAGLRAELRDAGFVDLNLAVQLSPAPGTGLQSPETGSQNRRYHDLSWRQRPHVPHLNPRKCPQIAGYSSETGKYRFASDCVVGPGVVPRRSNFNSLDCQMALSAITGAKGILRCCQISRTMISSDRQRHE
jgi:hypothetical protein